MTGFGPYASAKVPDRKYLWTVVALFGLLGLLGLGVLLYQPLRLRYAIYRVERDRSRSLSHPNRPNQWLEICLGAAVRGNPRAMDIVIDRHWVRMESAGNSHPESRSIAFLAAKAQPLVFMRALERVDDRNTLSVLWELASDGFTPEGGFPPDGGFVYVPERTGEAAALIKALQTLVNSDDPQSARLGAEARDFVQRRFARELAEPEKVPPTGPAR